MRRIIQLALKNVHQQIARQQCKEIGHSNTDIEDALRNSNCYTAEIFVDCYLRRPSCDRVWLFRRLLLMDLPEFVLMHLLDHLARPGKPHPHFHKNWTDPVMHRYNEEELGPDPWEFPDPGIASGYAPPYQLHTKSRLAILLRVLVRAPRKVEQARAIVHECFNEIEQGVFREILSHPDGEFA